MSYSGLMLTLNFGVFGKLAFNSRVVDAPV
jgi:hypothetical protein